MELPVLSDLLDLQEVDLEIDRLLERRQSLPELAEYQSVNASRIEAGGHRDEVQAQVRELVLSTDKSEGELVILETKLKESETRLFAGGMTAKETEFKRNEVQSLGAQKDALEERLLARLDDRENAEAALAKAEAGVTELLAVEKRLEEAIAVAWKEMDGLLGRKEARKSEIAVTIPTELLTLYERLRRTKEGVAVGRLDERGQCGGCHLHLSATEKAEAAESDPPLCVHCRRILVM